MQTERRGALLIADITGYSAYLNESELAHAEQTLSALLELLVDQTRPPMVVSKLEGDAVFSYGFEEAALHGQAFVESLEACYVEFRRALELMVLNTTCTCNACANISTLDLKFFVHHGEFVVGEAAGRKELHGPDVNLLHRMLKNTVTADTGFGAYVLYTRQAVENLGLDQLAGSWTAHVDSYPDVGEVSAWVEDLTPVWEQAQSEPRVEFDPADVSIEVSADIDLPVEVVWGYLIDPAYRRILLGSDRLERSDEQARVGEGSAYVCYHGDRTLHQVIVDWQPLRRIATRDTGSMPGGTLTFPVEYRLDPVDGGTRLTQRGATPEGSWTARKMIRLGKGKMVKQFEGQIEAFKERIEEDAAARLEAVERGA
jgi:uncharacterized protein YndB with AHSA1/START domain